MHKREFLKGSAVMVLAGFSVVPGVVLAESIAGDFVGSDWIRWDSVRKYYYVWGFRSGQNAGAVTALDASMVRKGSVNWRKAEARVGLPASVEQIVLGLDQVCSDYLNRSIPLWLLCVYVIESISGISDAEDLKSLRASYANQVLKAR